MQRNYYLFVLSLLLFSACVSTPVTKEISAPTVGTTRGAIICPSNYSSVKLHAILVADTKDTGIGSDIDLENMTKQLTAIQQNTCLTLNKLSITGDAFTKQHVNNTLNQLSVQPQDVVIFYYSGHGANLGSGRWPSLKVGDKFLDFDQVTRTLENKNPRLLISIADACNNFIDESSNTPTRQVTSPKTENYRQLFLGYQGKIKASAAKHGQFAAGGSQGGRYTNQFLDSLNKELAYADKPSWRSIMDRANSRIDFIDQTRQPQVQMPQYEIKIADNGVSGTPPETGNELSLQILPTETFQIGDKMTIKVTNRSPNSGYLFVWDIDSAGKLARLLPNEFSQQHRLDAGQTRQIPEHKYVGYSLTMKEPIGNGFIVALLADESARQQLLSENLSNLSANQAQTTLQQLRERLTQLLGSEGVITAVQYQIVR